jgi:tungstate transport system permease protein
MDTLYQGATSAFGLIAGLDAELISIVLRSLCVTGAAVAVASALGIPAGAVLALKRFPGRGLLTALFNTFMGLPPVVVGLFVYLILSRSGPLGFLGLLYTPTAMVIAQTLIAFPIIAALTRSAVSDIDPRLVETAKVLGATEWRAWLRALVEARSSVGAAVIAGLGRAIAEVGAVLIVGGNIAGYTRVMTTTIAMETSKGEFALAIALGIILLGVSFGINLAFRVMQGEGRFATP